MRFEKKLFAVVVALAAAGVTGGLWAESPRATTIVVEDLSCPVCAKKLSKAVSAVPGVVEVKADVPSSTLTVTPQGQKAPAPRALWEAVEKAGYRPTRLEGPAGTFTAKPAP